MPVLLTKDVLSKQVCSNCKKYLSIPPIKIYCNRQVKCGRCCKDDDGGTKSTLYEMVTKGLKFPCINHMEGCMKYCRISKMSAHENNCPSNKYHVLLLKVPLMRCPFILKKHTSI